MVKWWHNDIRQDVKKPKKAKKCFLKGLTRLADVANNAIIKIEQGENTNPTLETLKKVAKALAVSVDDLIE